MGHRRREGSLMLPRHILVVEDHAAIRSMVQLVLNGSGYRVTTASDGPTASAILADAIPDLLLLDLNLPDLSGWDLVTQVRATSTVPIILMSGHSRHEPALQGVLAQVQGYLEKPFDMDGLLTLVRQLL